MWPGALSTEVSPKSHVGDGQHIPLPVPGHEKPPAWSLLSPRQLGCLERPALGHPSLLGC